MTTFIFVDQGSGKWRIDIFLVDVLYTWCQHHVNKVDKENGCLGAKTVPRNHANKNTPHKNNGFMLFSAIKSIENTTKNAIQIP